MIQTDLQLLVTQERIRRFQDQLAHLRRTESNPRNYRASAAGFLAEIDRMELDVRDYLSHPQSQDILSDSPAAGGQMVTTMAD